MIIEIFKGRKLTGANNPINLGANRNNIRELIISYNGVRKSTTDNIRVVGSYQEDVNFNADSGINNKWFILEVYKDGQEVNDKISISGNGVDRYNLLDSELPPYFGVFIETLHSESEDPDYPAVVSADLINNEE